MICKYTMDLQGKHVFVSGAGKRVGRALALRFLEKGAHLSVTYRNSQKEAEELVDLAKKKGLKATTRKLDLSDFAQFERVTGEITQELGPPSVIVNSASDFFPTPLMKVAEDQWDRLHDANAKAHFFLTRAFLTTMKTGVIVNLADIHGERPLKNFAPYSASKAALLMFTKSLALELAPKIRVNAVSPGPVLLPENFTEDQTERARNSTLLKRIGESTDVVEAVLFLIENDYLTGVNLRVDGGASLV